MKINLLTGPVTISSSVKEAFHQDPISHRSDAFIHLFQATTSLLKQLTNAQEAIIMSGSGTLANEAIAHQLKQQAGKGLILSNGEFGNRLLLQATKAGLSFIAHQAPIATAFDNDHILRLLAEHTDIAWIWMVVHETSVGIWNDYKYLAEICKQQHILLALDCISAIGVKDLDFQDVYLASGVSGKAIAAYPGLSFVFSNQVTFAEQEIPHYIDLKYYQAANGIPFTINSNLVAALHQALLGLRISENETSIRDMSTVLLRFFESTNCSIINLQNPTPNVITIQLPSAVSSVILGNTLEKEGCNIGYKSNYLIEKNWIQTFLTHNNEMEEIETFCTKVDAIIEKLKNDQPVIVI